jgi:5-methylcytosine-specific restriction endonuclease McrA
MSRTFIPQAVRERVAAEARHRCGYCQTQQAVVGMPLHIDHIIPEAAGGSSEIENLWLACPLCNNYKGTQTHATDPMSGERVPLFNPRTQDWHVHFRWTDDGTEIVGLSPTGRATVVALKLNRAPLRRARRRWVRAGWHPPAD